MNDAEGERGEESRVQNSREISDFKFKLRIYIRKKIKLENPTNQFYLGCNPSLEKMKIDRIGSFSVAYSHNYEASVENWVGEVDVKQKWSCREKNKFKWRR